MIDDNDTDCTRRTVLTSAATASAMALAGCVTGETQTGASTEIPGNEAVPERDTGIEEWGKRLNEHARDADIDWRQFEGTELRFGMGLHPYSTTTEAVLPYFEELTGISVAYEKFAEDQFWLEAEEYLSDRSGRYDGIMVGLWPAGGYHWGTDGETWVRDLTQYIEDPALTDKDWLQMDDFLDQTLDLLTFQNANGSKSLVGFPNGIEAYGCTAIDVPTFEKLGLSEPSNFAELEHAAKTISESDEVDREGIVSRTSSTTLSSANWGTMFKTHGAEWIDRETREARLNSEAGITSLERFGGMLNKYGPENPGTYDWYANNNAYSEGRVGMMYSTPQTSGIVAPEQMERTKWLPPLQGPNGRDPVVDTWIWSTGISAFSENPKAAWLFIQWANSREANYMLSTKQWEGDQPRAGYARLDYVDQRDDQPPIPGEGYMNAFRKGMANVPTDPPPVPVDTPQNMNIMSEAASAMSSVVSGERTAKAALDAVAPTVTEHAQQIPEQYL